MQILSPINGTFTTTAALLAVPLIIWSANTASWKGLLNHHARTGLWLGSIAVLGVGWHALSIRVEGSLLFHPLLLSSLILVFGYRLAILGASLALSITLHLAVNALYPTNSSPQLWLPIYWSNWFLSVFLPITFTQLIISCVERLQIQNIFLYMLGCGFAGGIITMLATGYASLGILALIKSPLFESVYQNKHLFLLFAFPEGFCTGAIISTLTVFAPELVKTYDDRFYLKR